MKIKLFVSDIDGTLTDGKVYISTTGEQTIAYSKLDGDGFRRLRERKALTFLLSSEEKMSIHNLRGKQIESDYVYCAIKNKYEFLSNFLNIHNIEWSEVAYIGDDYSDLKCLQNSIISFCPRDSFVSEGNESEFYITKRRGGEGAVREAIEFLIKERVI